MIDETEIMIDETEIVIPGDDKECCGHYLPGMAELDRFLKNVSIRNNDDIYRGREFRYCPWCGEAK